MSALIGTVSPAAEDVKQLPLPPPFSSPGEDGHAPQRPTEPLTILTIGHSNLEAVAFRSLLRQHEITTVVDVRSAPYSRYAPQFSRGALRGLLDEAGIRYVWAGDVLGGRPDDPACYRDGVIRRGNVDYSAMARQSWYQDGIERLLTEAASAPIVVMCSEEDPRRCHRHCLIEPSLRERSVRVQHIRGDGTLETIVAEETAEETEQSPQLTLTGFDA
ncbi:MAG: DUF488 family protein [Thermomicrobiales bacterium]